MSTTLATATPTPLARKPGQGAKWLRPSTRQALYLRGGFACVYCGAGFECEGVVGTIDHVVPSVLGGSNDPSNGQRKSLNDHGEIVVFGPDDDDMPHKQTRTGSPPPGLQALQGEAPSHRVTRSKALDSERPRNSATPPMLETPGRCSPASHPW